MGVDKIGSSLLPERVYYKSEGATAGVNGRGAWCFYDNGRMSMETCRVSGLLEQQHAADGAARCR